MNALKTHGQTFSGIKEVLSGDEITSSRILARVTSHAYICCLMAADMML